MNGLRIGFDESSVVRLKQQFNTLIKDLNSQGKVNLDLNNFNQNIGKIKAELDSLIKNKIQLNTSSLDDKLKQTVQNIDEAIKQYENLGKTQATNIKYDENGNLKSFIVELERAENLVEKIKYRSTYGLDSGVNGTKPTTFKTDGVTITDNTSKALEQNLEKANKLIQQNADAEAKAQQKVDEAIQQTIANREKENKLLEERQAKAINKALEEEYQDNLKLAEAIGKAREQSELKAKEDERLQQIAQSKASNKAIEEEYAVQQKESSRVNNLGEFKSSFDPTLLNKTNAEIKSYMQNVLGANTQIMNIKKSTDGLGQSTVTLTTNVKNGNNVITQEKFVLDEATGSIYKESSAIKEVNDHHGSFIDRIKQSIAAVTSFGLITGSVYGTLAKFKEGISFINDLNKSQSNIQMISNMNSSDVANLTKQYSDLASQLHETTSGIMSASEEFLRAGNNAQETSALLQSSTVMSKIAGQSQQDSAQSLKLGA